MSQTVLVTGGGTGIGRAIALRFAADGADVIITGRRSAPLKETVDLGGGRVRAVECDNSDPEQVHALLDKLPPRIDVLVNNAGGNYDDPTPSTATASATRADDPADPSEAGELAPIAAEWLSNFTSNVLTAVLTTHAVADRLVDGGTVISLGSIAADKGAGSYGAAKAALACWNLTAAGDLGARRITANVIAPGYVAETEFFRDRMTTERRRGLVAATMTGRGGVPDDIAGTAAFLASAGARHITGQVIKVNGGAQTSR